MAILSLVGKQMRHLVGIAGRMFTTLGQGNVNIEMISQGANEINISCVIEGRDAIKALNLIHQSCLQIRPEGAKSRSEWMSTFLLFPYDHTDCFRSKWVHGYSKLSGVETGSVPTSGDHTSLSRSKNIGLRSVTEAVAYT